VSKQSQTTGRSASTLGVENYVLSRAAVSLVAIAYAAVKSDWIAAAVGAALFAQALIWTAIKATAPENGATTPLRVIRETTRLSAVTLLWGAAALLLAYPLLGLKWQHGWQYGLGAALISGVFIAYAHRISDDRHVLAQSTALKVTRYFSAAFAIALLGAVDWLVTSGKLATTKGDWLANDVFLAVAASLFVLAALAVLRTRAP
jgi:hypothetical protein